ncbi:MAG: FecR domain-containing protein [Leptolyngbya sp. SIO3F4]|nr:FecR domain-containing protein [Leptolyngbya sp. SIO3F4]
MPTSKRLNRRQFGGLMTATTLGVLLKPQNLLANSSYSRRWLRIQRLSGDVTTVTGQSKRARVGDYLDSIGHGLVTGHRSTAHLAIDDGIASVAIAQNTRITIQQLSVLRDGARITVLDVPQGQARFQVRQFTNPQSRLELRTPSGVTAVRGTTFGVSVNQQGQTNVATLEGQVEAGAQGVSVAVNAGKVSIIYPGAAPTTARDLDRDLDIRWNDVEWRDEEFYMAGYTDSANILWVNDQEISVDRAGYFEQTIPFYRQRRVVSVIVQNPLGETHTHSFLPRGE